MGRGSSGAASGAGNIYKQVVGFIKKNGIPSAFYNQGEDGNKAVYRAIDKYGKLTEAEKTVYNNIKENKENQTLWYSGLTRSTKGLVWKTGRGYL